MRRRYGPDPAHGPMNRPVLCIGFSVVIKLGSSRAIAVTAKAPGTMTRKVSPEATRCRPNTANGSRLRPSMTACSASAVRGSSSILRLLRQRDDPGANPRQSVDRNPKPVRAVSRLVADFVGRLFQQEQIEQRALVRLRRPVRCAFGVTSAIR